MALTEDDVRHVAKLSAIKIGDEDIPQLKQDLGEILNYVERLSSISTHGVPPTSHVHGVVNGFRDDIIKDSLPLDEVSRNAPDFAAGFFRVPKIVF